MSEIPRIQKEQVIITSFKATQEEEALTRVLEQHADELFFPPPLPYDPPLDYVPVDIDNKR